jgi:hypothetical protein
MVRVFIVQTAYVGALAIIVIVGSNGVLNEASCKFQVRICGRALWVFKADKVL